MTTPPWDATPIPPSAYEPEGDVVTQPQDEAMVQRCIDAVWNDAGLSVRLHRSEVERIVRTVLAASRQMDPSRPTEAPDA